MNTSSSQTQHHCSSQHSKLTSHHSTASHAVVTREAEAIWHLTELLSKLGDAGDDQVTLSAGSLRYVAGEISVRMNRIVEALDGENSE